MEPKLIDSMTAVIAVLSIERPEMARITKDYVKQLRDELAEAIAARHAAVTRALRAEAELERLRVSITGPGTAYVVFLPNEEVAP